jgi:Ca2+-binding RTX toxin-like protein
LSVRYANDPETEWFSADSMAEFQDLMFSGAINPGQIQIVREILMSPTEDFDTAVFSGLISEYSIEGGGVDEDGDGFITVSHNSVTLGLGQGADGVDKVRNIERLQFADSAMVISGANEPPAGELSISDDTPTEDQVISVYAPNVTDPDNIGPGNPTGAITGPISYFWQAEVEPGTGEFADLEIEQFGEVAKVTGTTFTPGDEQVGLALRVRAVYQDANGVIEQVFSAPTDVVANVDDDPVGTVLVSDTTPAEDAVLTAIRAFTDADGLNGATFTYQWQEFAGGEWANIDGAVTENFAPDQAQVGNKIRVIVSYTDDGGADESVTSTETAPVANTNDLPFGDLTIDDMTPTEGQALTATVEFVDQDGMTGATFLYQWQSFDGSDWVDIAGANASSFTPSDDEVNRELRVRVTYTDDFGTVESVTSLATIVTGDLVNGTAANELIDGTAGQDILFGGAGTDTLNGGAENDTLSGGEGNDAINGGSGDDTINFTMGEETDTVDGGDDFDTMNINGRAVNDTLRVLFDGSVLTRVSGGAVTNVESFNVDLLGGSDTLSYDPTGLAVTAVGITVDLNAGTATGFDSIAGIENAQGGSGNDTFVGDASNNNFAGGLGTDTYSLAHTSAGATILTNSASSAEAGLDGLSSIENYIGSQGNDTITVNGANNLIDGQGGNDTIDAGGGTDTVLGGAGNDTINYTVGNGADTVDGGDDFDTLAVRGTGGNNTLGVVFNGSVLTNVAGGAVTNVEAITLDLLGGTDTLSYGVSAAAVTVDLSAGTASGFTSILGVENVTGGNGGDTITGRAGVNVLSGGGGADRFIAQIGDGNDTINGDGGADTYDLSGTTAGATITTVSASSAQIGSDTLSSIENFIGSQGGDVIAVNGGPNVIDGQGGADNINAGGGADTVIGGAGDDTINGGTGNDTLVFGAGFGNDTIIGFDALPGGGGQDIIRLEASLGVTGANFGANVAISSVNAGADTLITIGGNTITLLGVASTDVTINDFTFGT